MKSDVTQGSILGAVLWVFFIDSVDRRTECNPSARLLETPRCSAVNTLDVIQRDLDILEKWAHTKFIKFNKAKQNQQQSFLNS